MSEIARLRAEPQLRPRPSPNPIRINKYAHVLQDAARAMPNGALGRRLKPLRSRVLAICQIGDIMAEMERQQVGRPSVAGSS